MPSCQSYGCSNETSGKSFKQEFKMFRIFIFLTQKKTKPEQKDGSITLEQDIQLKVFILKAKLFVVITFMPTVLKSIIGNTSKRRNFKSGAVPTIFKHKTYNMINMNDCKVKVKLQQNHPKWTARSKFIIIINELLLSLWAIFSFHRKGFLLFWMCFFNLFNKTCRHLNLMLGTF